MKTFWSSALPEIEEYDGPHTSSWAVKTVRVTRIRLRGGAWKLWSIRVI
jgi:hypothetical protein